MTEEQEAYKIIAQEIFRLTEEDQLTWHIDAQGYYVTSYHGDEYVFNCFPRHYMLEVNGNECGLKKEDVIMICNAIARWAMRKNRKKVNPVELLDRLVHNGHCPTCNVPKENQ